MRLEGGKGRTPVPDCESAKVATLKCGGPSTMPEESRDPWSKKFENRCYSGFSASATPTVEFRDGTISSPVTYLLTRESEQT